MRLLFCALSRSCAVFREHRDENFLRGWIRNPFDFRSSAMGGH